MADLPDLDTPLPDRAHEALRQATRQALDELAAEVSRVSDVLLLLRATADFAQSTLNTVMAAREAMNELGTRTAALETGGGQMQATLADLTARVTALENPPTEP